MSEGVAACGGAVLDGMVSIVLAAAAPRCMRQGTVVQIVCCGMRNEMLETRPGAVCQALLRLPHALLALQQRLRWLLTLRRASQHFLSIRN